jgi:hypothetical protein
MDQVTLIGTLEDVKCGKYDCLLHCCGEMKHIHRLMRALTDRQLELFQRSLGLRAGNCDSCVTTPSTTVPSNPSTVPGTGTTPPVPGTIPRTQNDCAIWARDTIASSRDTLSSIATWASLIAAAVPSIGPMAAVLANAIGDILQKGDALNENTYENDILQGLCGAYSTVADTVRQWTSVLPEQYRPFFDLVTRLNLAVWLPGGAFGELCCGTATPGGGGAGVSGPPPTTTTPPPIGNNPELAPQLPAAPTPPPGSGLAIPTNSPSQPVVLR